MFQILTNSVQKIKRTKNMNDNINNEFFWQTHQTFSFVKWQCHTWVTWITLVGNVKRWMWYNQSINKT